MVALLLTLGQVNAQDETTTSTDTTTNSETLDCSNKPCELTCPRQTTYRAGTNCTDSCDQKICSTKLECGCYCNDNYRKINGKCERKASCPRGTTSNPGNGGIFGGRPGLLLGQGGGRPGLLPGGGLGNRLGLGNRRKAIAAMLQQIKEENNSTK